MSSSELDKYNCILIRNNHTVFHLENISSKIMILDHQKNYYFVHLLIIGSQWVSQESVRGMQVLEAASRAESQDPRSGHLRPWAAFSACPTRTYCHVHTEHYHFSDVPLC